MKPEQKQEVLAYFKERDQEFIKRFCQEGTFIGDEGAEIHGVCRPVEVSEVLEFVHAYDASLLDLLGLN